MFLRVFSDVDNSIIDLYITGYNCREIAFQIGKHDETIRKIIRNYKETLSFEEQTKLKKIHQEFREEKFGESNRFNKKLKRKYMRTSEAVKRNQSAYKLNRNKTGQVYNNRVGARPSDLPRSF